MNRLIAEVEIRLRNKYSELENMKSWIQVKGCRREYVLQQFGYRKEQELMNCCDYHGITKEDYKKDERNNRISTIIGKQSYKSFSA